MALVEAALLLLLVVIVKSCTGSTSRRGSSRDSGRSSSCCNSRGRCRRRVMQSIFVLRINAEASLHFILLYSSVRGIVCRYSLVATFRRRIAFCNLKIMGGVNARRFSTKTLMQKQLVDQKSQAPRTEYGILLLLLGSPGHSVCEFHWVF